MSFIKVDYSLSDFPRDRVEMVNMSNVEHINITSAVIEMRMVSGAVLAVLKSQNARLYKSVRHQIESGFGYTFEGSL